MKRCLLLLSFLVALSGCSIRFVSNYDEVIDKGIAEFSEQLGGHVKNMGELGGRPEGTYDANLKTYNALEAKLDVLIDRANSAAEGKGCQLEDKVFQHISSVMNSRIPVGIQQGTGATPKTASACNARLLVIVREQLFLIREIHKTTDKCGKGNVSCLRPATAKSAMAIANQSINAVSVVEAAKKSL
jgi:hypothetical protein